MAEVNEDRITSAAGLDKGNSGILLSRNFSGGGKDNEGLSGTEGVGRDGSEGDEEGGGGADRTLSVKRVVGSNTVILVGGGDWGTGGAGAVACSDGRCVTRTGGGRLVDAARDGRG